jgi:uncharacterized protein with PIN domain
MKFICDAMLGKLAKYLRILGFDAIYIKNINILQNFKGSSDPPFFLTRSTKAVPYDRVVLIKSDKVRDQIEEISNIVRPCIDPVKIMNRCIECNVQLSDVAKERIEQKVPEFIFHRYGQFRECPQCGKVYWEGSHTTGMTRLIEEIMSREDNSKKVKD